MIQWVYVENDEIIEKHEWLPMNWRNYSGLHLSYNDINFLNSIGWYKVVREDQTYDTSNYRLVGYNYSLENNQAIETVVLEEISQQEKDFAIEQDNIHFMSELRSERNRLLRESDWTQLADVIERNGQEWYQNWSTYRQSLRDLPSNYSTRTEINWPQPPL